MGCLRNSVPSERKVHQPWIDHNDKSVNGGLAFLNDLAEEAGESGWLAGPTRCPRPMCRVWLHIVFPVWRARNSVSRMRIQHSRHSLHGWRRLKSFAPRLCRNSAVQPFRQIFRPEPGRPRSLQIASTLSMTASDIRISRPHSRFVSGGHLLVASRPILEPSPSSGLAKSR